MIMASLLLFFFFFFYDTAPTNIYTYCHTLSLHDALPICHALEALRNSCHIAAGGGQAARNASPRPRLLASSHPRIRARTPPRTGPQDRRPGRWRRTRCAPKRAAWPRARDPIRLSPASACAIAATVQAYRASQAGPAAPCRKHARAARDEIGRAHV